MNKMLLYLFLIIFSTLIPLYAQDITSAVVTNVSYSSIPQYELPKRYLIDGQSTLYPKENPFRRADIIFFLSIPITMFIMQNIINFINIFNIVLENYNTDLGRDNFGFTSGEWNFIISALILIPMGVTIYDAVYVNRYPILPPFEQDTFKEARMNFSVYRMKF